jgi:hypothetical protein
MDHNQARGKDFIMMGPETMWEFDGCNHIIIYMTELIIKVKKVSSDKLFCITK